MKYERGTRLAERIKERVAQVILFELHDPRIGFVTVTRAKMSKDMSRIEVYYSVLGTEGDRSRVEHALQDARGYVQHEIAKVCETRSVPHLEFVFDRSVEGAFKMERLLDDLKKERGDEPAPPTDASAPDDEKPEAEKKDDDA
ncbi:MAG: 30S ribosome-binding factor RbfA [Planctomycetes bacterium]|nr:30S ribosome-binding factor RbfA [Planctomycetota bacterium]